MNPFNTTPPPNFDSLLLHSLTTRPPRPHQAPPPPLDHLLLNNLNLSDTDSDQEYDSSSYSSITRLAKEESNLEKQIIKTILSGNSDSLKPNSGQAVSIGDHHICVGFHNESGSNEYRVWEWHGHIMLFDEEDGYTPEYIYGNYFEWVKGGKEVKEKMKIEKLVDDDDEKEEEEMIGNLGLKDLIDSRESNGGRILHRNVNAGSPRF